MIFCFFHLNLNQLRKTMKTKITPVLSTTNNGEFSLYLKARGFLNPEIPN